MRKKKHTKRQLVYGVGVNDLDELVLKETSDGRKKFCPLYKAWEGVLCRCFSEKWKEKYPTYKDCTICAEWLSRKKFTEWARGQDWEGKQLDKDILIPGNKHYSPETCVFVSSDLNKFLTNTDYSRSKYLVGASYDKSINKFRGICSNPKTGKQEKLGTFDTQEEAHYAWACKKLEHARRISENINDKRIGVALVSRFEKILFLAESNLHKV